MAILLGVTTLCVSVCKNYVQSLLERQREILVARSNIRVNNYVNNRNSFVHHKDYGLPIRFCNENSKCSKIFFVRNNNQTSWYSRPTPDQIVKIQGITAVDNFLDYEFEGFNEEFVGHRVVLQILNESGVLMESASVKFIHGMDLIFTIADSSIGMIYISYELEE